MAGPIRIAIVGDTKDFAKSTAQIDAALEKTASKSQKVGKAIDAGAKIAAVGFLAAGAGALKLAQGAAEDEKAAAALAKTLKNTAGATKGQVAATEDWITAQGKALGVADDQLRPALSALATATGDVGKAQQLASLAMDISAGSGKSLESVTAALVKAQNGSVGGLSKLGIATKDASGKTKDFATLQDELAQKFKGQAATAANTAEGKMQRFKLALAEAGESIGAMLLPALTKLGTWLTDKVVPALDSAFSWMDSHQTTVKVLAIGIAGLGAAFIAASLAMKVYAAGSTIVAAASKAWAAAQWLVNAALSANPIGLIVLAIAGLVAGLVVAYKKSETFRDIVNGAFQAIMSVVGPVIDWFKTFIPAAFEVVKGVFTTYFDAYKAVVTTVFTAVKTVIETYINIWKTVIETALNAIKATFTAVWNAVKTVTSTAFAGIKALVTGPLDDVVDFIKGVPGKITALGGKFKEAGTAIMTKIVEGIKGAAGFIGDIASGIWNAVKSMVNQGIDKINAALEFSIKIGPKTFTVNPPDIPHLAQGGITTGPTLAMIGDNPGGREAVIPLDKYDLSGDQLNDLLAKILAAILNQTSDQSADMRTLIAATAGAPTEFARATKRGAGNAARSRNRGALA